MALSTRLTARRAFYRLITSDGNDSAWTENGEAVDEVANDFIQYGLWNAQKYLIGLGYRDWLKVSAALVWTLGADGLRSVALPTDFLRLAGDERTPSVRTTDGRAWGGLISGRSRAGAGSAAFWIENGKIWLGSGAAPPTGLTFEYHYRHATLTLDADVLDFPIDWLPMVPAEAAVIAMHEGWYLVHGGEAKIVDNLEYWQRRAAPWFRTTGEAQKLRPPPMKAPNIFI